MFKGSRDLPTGFDHPTSLPQTEDQARAWQEINRSWWEQHPMRYDFDRKLDIKEHTPEWYREIDQRFFQAAEEYVPRRSKPFDRLIPYEQLKGMDVLEIGVGNGSHAALLAAHAKSFTGIDLTEYAINSTGERFRLCGLNGRLLRMDAEKMDFPDASFDFVWTWGVIHHSADTRAILEQMRRVLRPGGKTVVMVYYRNVWEYYLRRGVLRGALNGSLWREGSLHKVVQLSTDGGLARYYTKREWQKLAGEFFHVDRFHVFGQINHMIPLPGRLRNYGAKITPGWLARIGSNRLGLGQYLVAEMTRRD